MSRIIQPITSRIAGPFLGEQLGGSAVVVPPSFSTTKSILFDGVDEFLSRADSNLQDFSTTMSLSVWCKGAGIGNYGAMIQKGENTLIVTRGYAVLDSGDSPPGKVNAQLFDATQQRRYATSVAMLDGTWHHFVFTFSSGTLLLYIDRVLDSSATKPADQAVNSLNNTAFGLHMGCQVTGVTPATFFAGQLCNVSLWSSVLNQTAITALATAGKPADLSLHADFANCVSWYRLGDGDTIAADGILDSTANALHLSPTNMDASNIITDAP